MILRDSRYEAVTVYSDRGEVYLGTRQPAQMAPAEDDRFLTWRPNDRPDLFAYRAWGDEVGERAVMLAFVLLDINNVVNPFDVKPGTVLRVPSLARVVLEVLQ